MEPSRRWYQNSSLMQQLLHFFSVPPARNSTFPSVYLLHAWAFYLQQIFIGTTIGRCMQTFRDIIFFFFHVKRVVTVSFLSARLSLFLFLSSRAWFLPLQAWESWNSYFIDKYIYCTVSHSTVTLLLGYQFGLTYAVQSKRFRPDQLFKVTEIKQLCYFST